MSPPCGDADADQDLGFRYPSLCRRFRRREAGCPSGQRERSVKPSAQPTLVRTPHLPPPAETARGLGIPGPAGRLAFIPLCVMMCRCEPRHGSGYGHMADGIGPEQAVHRTACSPDLPRSAGLGDGGTMGREDHWRLSAWPIHSPQNLRAVAVPPPDIRAPPWIRRHGYAARACSPCRIGKRRRAGPHTIHRMRRPTTDESAPPAMRALRPPSADLGLTCRVPPVNLAWTPRAGVGGGGRSKRALTCAVLVKPPVKSSQAVKSKTADHLPSMLRPAREPAVCLASLMAQTRRRSARSRRDQRCGS